MLEKLENNSSAKFYYPSCKSNDCDGVLKITINNIKGIEGKKREQIYKR